MEQFKGYLRNIYEPIKTGLEYKNTLINIKNMKTIFYNICYLIYFTYKSIFDQKDKKNNEIYMFFCYFFKIEQLLPNRENKAIEDNLTEEEKQIKINEKQKKKKKNKKNKNF